MNRLLILFLTLLISSTYPYTQVEILKGKYPFNKIIEWPNQGSILLAKDPSGATNDVYINLLNHEGESIWGKYIYPKSKNPKLILSGNSNYIYFVDNFKPESNMIYYNQVNQSGGIVSTKFDVLKVIRAYGYTTPNDLELNDIINTPKSLVFYFQLPIKSKGIIENIFISITHHNNRVYDYKGPSTDIKLLKKGIQDPVLYAGADESIISFSTYSSEEHKNSVNFTSFSPKAEPSEGQSLKLSSIDPIISNIQAIALDGSFYIDNKSQFQARGKGVYLNKQYYYLLNDSEVNCLRIYGLDEKNKIVQLNNCEEKQNSSRNPKGSISYFEMDNDLYIISEIGDAFTSYKIDKGGVKNIKLKKNDLENIQLNPSYFKTENKSSDFVHFINGTPYYTNKTGMEKQEKIIFKQ